MQWAFFQSSHTTSFQDIRDDGELLDVTLVCDDGRQLEAHKVVLSANSSVFRQMLTRNIHPHPLIFLTEQNSKKVGQILDFLYKGEVGMPDNEVTEFLELSRKLQIKSLDEVASSEKSGQHLTEQDDAGNEFDGDFSTSSNITEHDPVENTEVYINQKQISEETKEKDAQHPAMETDHVGGLKYTCSLCKESFKSYHVMKIHSVGHKGKSRRHEKIQFTGEEPLRNMLDKLFVTKEGQKECTICGKTTQSSAHAREHAEIHIEGLEYPCMDCGKIMKTSTTSRHHKKMCKGSLPASKNDDMLEMNYNQKTLQQEWIKTKDISQATFLMDEKVDNIFVPDKEMLLDQITKSISQENKGDNDIKNEDNTDNGETTVREMLNKIVLMKDGFVECAICGKRSKHTSHAREHAEIHIEGLEYPCRDCGKSLKTSSALRQHRDRSKTCKGSVLTTKKDDITEMKHNSPTLEQDLFTTIDILHPRSLQDKKVDSDREISVDEIIPTIKQENMVDVDSKDEETNVDATVTTVREMLDKFILMKDGFAECTVCGKRSKHSGHAREHVEIHLQGLEYPCMDCGKSFKTSSTMRQHKRLVHKN